MRNAFKYAALAALLLVLPVAAQAQTTIFGPFSNAVPVTVGVQRTAGDTAPALYIKYVGDDAVPATGATTIATVADTSITFVLNGAAYDGFECPVAAPLGGVILTGDAACDTLGEVVDAINSDTKNNFVAFIGAGLRTDVIETTTNLLADAADNDVLTPQGEIIYWDVSVSDDEELPFWDVNLGAAAFVQPGQNTPPKGSPFKTSDSVLMYGWEQFTNAGTLTDLTLYCVVENYDAGTETVQVLYNEPLAATTVFNAFANDIDGGIHCRRGKMFARATLSAADTSAWNFGLYGYRAPLQ